MYHTDSDDSDWMQFFNNRLRLNPKDWKLSHKIPVIWTNDHIVWLEKNTPGRWLLEGWNSSRSGVVKFSRSEDAMAFKLRWL